MAGITDTIFRRIIRKMGAGLVYSEMVSCMALHYDSKKTFEMLEFHPEELPLALQIFGADPVLMADAAKVAESRGVSIIDINLGCSVPKVAKSGSGAILCRNLPLLASVMESVVKAVTIPVTIKIRIGWTKQEVSAFEVCRMAKECGIAAIALHGRTSSQAYSGTADWDFIKEVRQSTDLPFIGNGDVKTPESAVSLLDSTGCDGIMIGRESYFNPWFFRDLLKYSEKTANSQSVENPENEVYNRAAEVKELILHQLEENVARYGEYSGVQKMRKFAAWYTRGLRGSARFREHVNNEETLAGMKSVIDEYFGYCGGVG
ncbi:MAG: tRNA dihydrouridine synthase DusB [Firmicutes bacterium]|nr:tRNA dihydrouridine synthase DusB [Bacillota bacterium]